jgi:hypothetical protein
VNRYLAINIEEKIGQSTVIRTSSFNMRQATCLKDEVTVGKMNGTVVTNRLQNSFKITCTDHRIIEILGLRPSNRLPVSYYFLVLDVNRNLRVYYFTQGV